MPHVTGDAGSSSPLFPDRKSGVWGQSDSGYGVAGTANGGNGVQAGSITGYGAVGTSSQSIGVFGISENKTGVYGRSDAARDGHGVIGDGTTGVYGHSASGFGYGVVGVSEGGTSGVVGSSSNIGVGGSVVSADSGGVGVAGFGGLTTFNTGVYGESGSGAGVHGRSHSGTGIYAESDSGTGLFAQSNSGGTAAYFSGKVDVSGRMSLFGDLETIDSDITTRLISALAIFAPFKLFKIDHPLDPANKYLYHACVESPDRKNLYDGTVVLDAQGEAVVELPEWFEALNCEFRYQLTCIGAFAPVYIAEELTNNQFKIAGGQPGLKISWQVTGVRHDPVARTTPMVVEEDKPAHERGFYQNPEAHGQPEERGLHRERDAAHQRRHEQLRRFKPPIPEQPISPKPPSLP